MKLNKYDSKKELENQLSAELIQIVKNAIEKYGRAHILLSGGSTPLNLYTLFGSAKFDSSLIEVGLVDERFVPYSSEYNNARKISEALNRSNSQSFEVHPMSVSIDNRSENLHIVESFYGPFFERIDFCLLGMGEDGHTASLFPGDEASSRLLSQEENKIDFTKAPDFPHERISCNKHLISQSKCLALMLVGEKKLDVFNSAKEKDLPIAHFMNKENELKVYYAPS